MRIDRELAEKGSRTIVRLTNALTVTAGIPLVVLAIMIPGYRAYTMKKWQHTARSSLEYIHRVQMRYLAEHKRFATFDEVGFMPSPFYTYRIDGSGNPGTIILATSGKVTPDNSIISAGISAAPAAFTITATANLDFDATLDQWHINDSRPAPIHDVNDRTF